MTKEERQNMISFIIQIYSNYTEQAMNILNDDDLNAVYLDAYNYSDWGL